MFRNVVFLYTPCSEGNNLCTLLYFSDVDKKKTTFTVTVLYRGVGATVLHVYSLQHGWRLSSGVGVVLCKESTYSTGEAVRLFFNTDPLTPRGQ